MSTDFVSLSKMTAHALRHEPWLYELELDEQGFVPIIEFLKAVHERTPWTNTTEVDLMQMIANADKKRYEIVDGKIRAFYGHSTPNKIEKQSSQPPALLYHGTTSEIAEVIFNSVDGLKPMSRQYVHLSVDHNTAHQVGRRKARTPTILIIDAEHASSEGILFYHGNELVWLADSVPSKYIR